eukprot:1684223-Prymnesium_polylepis.1
MAAASRWYKARKAAAIASGSAMPTAPVPPADQPVVPDARHARRGEFESLPASYRQYEQQELLSVVLRVQSKELKMTEVKKLYVDGKTRVPPTA